MKLKIWIYSLSNANGDTSFSTVNDPGDNICIGVYDNNGVYQQYDSYEAYHLDSFCAKHEGFSYNCAEVEIEVPHELTN